MKYKNLFEQLNNTVGKRHVLTSKRAMSPYVKGFREGEGPALAVVRPGSLVDMWRVLKLCIAADVAIIIQAANTGLTGGSTPSEGCDRDIVLINTTRIDDIHLLHQQQQIVALAGATLYTLQKLLAPQGRAPHSVIGSSCIGASIVGGVCNNSGGALVQRGPAYTELAVFAEVDAQGELRLVNNLDINLGDTPEEILAALDTRSYSESDIKDSARKASDDEYQDWVRDTHSHSPARYNADPRRLHKASGCAGKLAVFAVRLDSFAKETQQHTFYLGTNNANTLQTLRIALLKQSEELPISAEYLHRDVFDITQQYGRDTMLLIKYLGTTFLPTFFKLKRQASALADKWRLPKNFIEKCIFGLSRCIPCPIPALFKTINQQFEHQLILTVADSQLAPTQTLLHSLKQNSDLHSHLCTEDEAENAYLLRFAAAGAAVQYAAVNDKHCGGLVALDIALPRNTQHWQEVLPEALDNAFLLKLYYGHFLCHVLHQDYVLKRDQNPDTIKKCLLKQLDNRGAKYPAEHNVGQIYTAEPALAEHYQNLDPGNNFNPGIGKLSKQKHYR